MNLNGREYYYVRNAQGDITGLLDINGKEVVKYSYDSWGKLISIEGKLKDSLGLINPYRYRGYRCDNETGLYYLQSRYYNPEICRMLNADSFGGNVGELLTHNAFVYCCNNPVNREDPNGHFWGFIKEFVSQVANAINTLRPVYAVAGGCELEPGPGTIAGLVIAGVTTIGAVGYAGYQTYKTYSTTSSKSKTKAVPISIENSEKQKPSYWEAEYNKSTKNVDIGRPISQGEAIARVSVNKSIMCSNATKALQVARNFSEPKLEINVGKFGEEGFYPHYHINGGHGDPHIWFFPGGN